MRLSNFYFDLWQLIQPEHLALDENDREAPIDQPRSPAALPYASNLKTLQRGEGAMLIFHMQPTPDEITPGLPGRIQTLWVAVTERCGDYYIGVLTEHPAGNYADRDFYLAPGAEVPFLPLHIVDVYYPPLDFDIEKVLQRDSRRLWSRDDSQQLMGDPVLNELLTLADHKAVKELQEKTASLAFGIGRTTGQTWTDRLMMTVSNTLNGADAFMEAVTPLRERAQQKTLVASVICNHRVIQRTSGEESMAIVMLLENAIGYAIFWLRTYRLTPQGYEFDELTAQFCDAVVFASDR
jgi:hypothetical protein